MMDREQQGSVFALPYFCLALVLAFSHTLLLECLLCATEFSVCVSCFTSQRGSQLKDFWSFRKKKKTTFGILISFRTVSMRRNLKLEWLQFAFWDSHEPKSQMTINWMKNGPYKLMCVNAWYPVGGCLGRLSERGNIAERRTTIELCFESL